MKKNTHIRFDMTHYLDVLRAKQTRSDLEGVEATRYMDKALAQATAQIQRPSRKVAERVSGTFMSRFMEAL